MRGGGLGFTAIRPSTADTIALADGCRSQVLLSWGDPLLADLPPFDIDVQNAADQERRFGFNCDFVAFLPLPAGSHSADEGLLWVNHEYTDGAMMFPDYDRANPPAEQIELELAAHGAAIVHVRRSSAGSERGTYGPVGRAMRGTGSLTWPPCPGRLAGGNGGRRR